MVKVIANAQVYQQISEDADGGPIYYGSADDKDLEVDISGLAGVEVGTIMYWYWYEAIA